jgi:hypothetical protein
MLPTRDKLLVQAGNEIDGSFPETILSMPFAFLAKTTEMAVVLTAFTLDTGVKRG